MARPVSQVEVVAAVALEVARRARGEVVDLKGIYRRVEGLPLLEYLTAGFEVLDPGPGLTMCGRNRRYDEVLEIAVLLVSVPSTALIFLSKYAYTLSGGDSLYRQLFYHLFNGDWIHPMVHLPWDRNGIGVPPDQLLRIRHASIDSHGTLHSRSTPYLSRMLTSCQSYQSVSRTYFDISKIQIKHIGNIAINPRMLHFGRYLVVDNAFLVFAHDINSQLQGIILPQLMWLRVPVLRR